MKRFLVMFLLIFCMVGLKAQGLYFSGDTVKGKNASYYCIEQSDRTIKVRNTQNIDTLEWMYFDNGERVPGDWVVGGQFNFEEFLQEFKRALTPEELEQLKRVRGFFQVHVTADKAGKTLELEFSFLKNDPVFSRFDPDRLFRLELRLKRILRLQLGENGRNIKHVKYLAIVTYYMNLE